MAKKKKSNQLPIPPDAVKDPKSIEMIRAWIANNGLHISLKIGIWKGQDVEEDWAWGVLFADAIRHVANAMQDGDGHDPEDTIRAIKRELDAQLDAPTRRVRGKFVKPLAEDD